MFSTGFFTAYVVVAFIWAWVNFVICVLMPVWESRKDMAYFLMAILRDAMGRKVHLTEWARHT